MRTPGTPDLVRWVAGAAIATVVLAGCVGARTPAGGWQAPIGSPGHTRPVTSATGTWAAASPSVGPAISALSVTSNLWVGTSDLLFEAYDASFALLSDRSVPITVRLERPDGTLLGEQPADVVQPTPGQRRMYRARVLLDVVGTWRLHVATAGGGPTTTLELPVLPDDGSPPLGAPFPAVHTPTGASVANAPGGLAAISTVPGADPTFYERSVDELLARGEAFVLTIDSVAFRTTMTCGAGLGHLIHLHHELPAVRMVHAEPYRMRLEGETLLLDTPDGTPQPTDWARALGATEPPWIFVVGGDGRLWAKFHGIFGSDELRSAIDTVLSRP